MRRKSTVPLGRHRRFGTGEVYWETTLNSTRVRVCVWWWGGGWASVRSVAVHRAGAAAGVCVDCAPAVSAWWGDARRKTSCQTDAHVVVPHVFCMGVGALSQRDTGFWNFGMTPF